MIRKIPYLSDPLPDRQSWTEIRFHARCIILHDSLETQGHDSIRSERKRILERESPRPMPQPITISVIYCSSSGMEDVTLRKAKSRPHAVYCFNIGRENRDNTAQRNELNLLFQQKQTASGNSLKIRGSERRMGLETVFPVSAAPRITWFNQISEQTMRLNERLHPMALPLCSQYAHICAVA
jgi:hypothetical protein